METLTDPKLQPFLTNDLQTLLVNFCEMKGAKAPDLKTGFNLFKIREQLPENFQIKVTAELFTDTYEIWGNYKGRKKMLYFFVNEHGVFTEQELEEEMDKSLRFYKKLYGGEIK